MPSKLFAALAAGLVTLAIAAPAAHANANVAALQVALKALHHYHGPIDGLIGPQTRRATRRFQRAHGLRADGVAGPRTRRALGKRGRPRIGSRVMKRGHRGWDVAGLQYMLTRRGYRTSIDGGFGSSTEATVRRFQSARGLTADGLAGRATISALKRRGSARSPSSNVGGPSGPVRFLRPVSAPMGDGFGLRSSGRMHHGIDFPAPAGARVNAAGVGVTEFAGWNAGGYGYLVVVQHRLGFETWYAHLSRITTWPGERVSGGTRIGLVGSTGRSTGPHLHWEVRLNGVPINPLPRLLNRVIGSGVAASPLEALECAGDDGGPGEGEIRPDNPPPKRLAEPGPAFHAEAELPAC